MKHFIVVDMQNDFVDGALGTKEAEAIVQNVKEKILSYPEKDVVVTLDTHEENYLDTQEGKFLPVVHCIRGTEGWKHRIRYRRQADLGIHESYGTAGTGLVPGKLPGCLCTESGPAVRLDGRKKVW